MIIHPKAAGTALGSSLGVLIVAILHSFHGVSLAPEANAAIPGFLATLGAFLVPASSLPAPSSPPSAAAPVAPASPSGATGDSSPVPLP